MHFFIGDPVKVFRYLHSKYTIERLSCEHDAEPIFLERDEAVKSM